MKEKPRKCEATEGEFSQIEGVANSAEYSSMQGVTEVGLQFWVRKTQSLFLYSYLLITVLFSIWTNYKPAFAPLSI